MLGCRNALRELLKNNEPPEIADKTLNKYSKGGAKGASRRSARTKKDKPAESSAAPAADPSTADAEAAHTRLTRLFERCENLVFAHPPPPRPAVASHQQALHGIDIAALSLCSPPNSPTNSPAPASACRRDLPCGPGADTLPQAECAPTPPGLCSTQHQREREAQQEEQLRIMQRLDYTERCKSDSEALMASCPPDLRRVHMVFPKQAAAFECADKFNTAMPLLPVPKVLLSKLANGASNPPRAAGQSTGAAAALSAAGRSNPQPQPQQSDDMDIDDAAPGQQQQSQQAAPAAAAAPAHTGVTYYSPYLMAEEARQQAAAVEELERCKGAMQEAHARYRAALQMKVPRTPGQAAACGSTPANANDATNGARPAAASAPPSPLPPPAAAGAAIYSVNHAEAAPAPPAPCTSALHEQAVAVFCVERPSKGRYYRCFAAASYPAVWAAYQQAEREQQLHYYEVIREGRPCHLYFDLEFATAPNPGLDGVALVDLLVGYVKEALHRHFELPMSEDCLYELDSSTPEKFSRHLVLHIPGHAFATNTAAGQFVAAVLADAGDALGVVTAEATLETPAQRGCVVDTAVYSRNRHFRMAFSCKGGKTARLVPTGRFATKRGDPTAAGQLSPALVFQQTLIGRVEPGATLLLMQPPGTEAERGAGRGGVQGEVGPGVGGTGRRVTWKQEAGEGGQEDRMEALKVLAEQAVGFIEGVASQRGGAQARVRTIAFCGFDGLVAYSMIGAGSHFCENVGRPHGSNHVYFVADFEHSRFAQKCYDPSCSRYRSAWMPMPKQLCLPSQEPPALA